MPLYLVSWSFKMSTRVQAESAKRAVEIADDMGDTQADFVTTGPKRAVEIDASGKPVPRKSPRRVDPRHRPAYRSYGTSVTEYIP